MIKKSDENIPTTRPALFFPCSLDGLILWGTAEAAILVMLIELVFVARIASGLSSCENAENIDCFSDRFSETAYIFLHSLIMRLE